MSVRLSILLAVAMAAACRRAPPSGPPPSPSEAPEAAARSDEPASPSTTVDVDELADRRVWTPAIAAPLREGPTGTRRAAARAVAELSLPATVPSLLRAMLDEDGVVRMWAARGLGEVARESPGDRPAITRALRSGLVGERAPEARARILIALAIAEDDALESVLARALEADHAMVRSAACTAIRVGVPALRTSEVLAPLVARRVRNDPDGEVRVVCAAAYRTGIPSVARETFVAALTDAAPETAIHILRSLDRSPDPPIEPFATAARSVDARVAALAVGALAHHATRTNDRALASAIEAAADRPSVLYAALLAARSVARGPNVRAAVERLYSPTLVSDPDSSDGRYRALAHCLAAEILDIGRGWPDETLRCGGAVLSDADRAVAEAHVLADAAGGETARAARLLQSYERDPTPRVRAELLLAAASIDAVDATTMIERALASADPILIAAALDSLLTGDAAAGSTRRTTIAVRTQTSATLLPALHSSVTTLWERNHLEGLILFARVAAKAQAAELAGDRARLRTHANVTIRRAATLPGDPPIPAVRQPPREPWSRAPLPARATIETVRGRIVIELFTREAARTVRAFVRHARAAAYDRTAFHRIVPGFVAQGGDSSRTGYGGAEVSLRNERNQYRYRRGTVGIATAGRDTGGAQFFISLARYPHLDDDYSIFGEVREGLDVIDSLAPGDEIVSVRVE